MSQSKRFALRKPFLNFCLGCLVASGTSTAVGQVGASSNGGNAFLHAIGWQTFENAGTNNTSGILDSTPDSNSTFDSTPIGSNNGGLYLTGRIGVGASILGRQGLGQSEDNSFLNGPDFGTGPGNNGLNIIDITLADGSAGTRIGPNSQPGASSWRFQRNGEQEFGDFSITNESDYSFRLERIHYDARSANTNAARDLDLIYLAGGESNLIRAGGFNPGTEVPDLHVISEVTFPSSEILTAVHNVSRSVPASFIEPTAVRLAPGDTASFRFRWTNSMTDFAQSQIDNLAISGTFLDQNNDFAPINPIDVLTAPSVPGDFDDDGDVDIDDIDFYVGNIGASAAGALAELDFDGNGTVTIGDLNNHITTLVEPSNGAQGALIGDLNLDGRVDVLGDALSLVTNLNSTGLVSYGQGNLNADLMVNVLGDALILVTNLGQNNDP